MSDRQSPQSKVSVEDLLRLKRAERPASAFWTEFDDQLRRKQLAAIVDKRPWWRRVSVSNLAKLTLPVGATAVLTIALINVRERSQYAADLASVAPTSVSSPLGSMATPGIAPAGVNTAAVRSSVAAQEQAVPAMPAIARDAIADSATVSGQVVSKNSGEHVAGRDTSEPSLAQVILGLEGTMEGDVRLDHQPASEIPMLASLSTLVPSSAQIIATADSDSLTQVSSSRNDRRARLLASVDSQERSDMISGNSRVARSRERIANRLAEQSLYDSISRLGLNGDSVSIKF